LIFVIANCISYFKNQIRNPLNLGLMISLNDTLI